MNKNIGLTMRVVQNQTYPEARDAIAHDWYDYLKNKNCNIILLPNTEDKILSFLDLDLLDGVILTGGNDLNSDPRRENTEDHIIKHCLQRDIALVGVCRGFQKLNHFFHGQVSKVSPSHPVTPNHKVKLRFGPNGPNQEIEVNSYHDYGVLIDELSPELTALGYSEDERSVEAFKHNNRRILAFQWHPERKNKDQQIVDKILNDFLRLKDLG